MTCPDCNGCGEKLIPVVLTDPATGQKFVQWVSATCPTCGGEKEV